MKYTNPILASDFSDPDVIRDGEDFYMVSSSFNFNPGLPVLHSKNLVEWELIGHIIDELPLDEYKQFVHGGGVWAPAIRKHGGTYYCTYPLYGHGIWVSKTDDIRGKWSKPWCIFPFAGAEDPCPIWTDDGRCYLAIGFAKSKAGFNSQIAVLEVKPDLSETVSENYAIVYDGHNDNPCIEGPKFYKHGDYYYIYCPAGGVKHGWQTALRSKNIYGPYESKIVLMRHDSSINGPHQGALVDLPDGGWAFVHFCDKDAYGRITYLQPAKWIDDWCICGNVTDERISGTPVEFGDYPVDIKTGYTIPYSDDFKNGVSPVWQTPAVCGSDWYKAQNGLRISADEQGIYNRERMLTQRFSAYDFTAETEADVSAMEEGYAALAVIGFSSYSLCLSRGLAELRIDNEGKEEVVWSKKLDKDKTAAKLGVEVYRNIVELSKLTFYIDGEKIPVDMNAAKGRWVGARVALYANGRGEAEFKYFNLGYELKSRRSIPIFSAGKKI